MYCLESADLPGQNVFDIAIPSSIKFQPVAMKIDNGNVMGLTGEARLIQNNNWKNTLYKEVNTTYKTSKDKIDTLLCLGQSRKNGYDSLDAIDTMKQKLQKH